MLLFLCALTLCLFSSEFLIDQKFRIKLITNIVAIASRIRMRLRVGPAYFTGSPHENTNCDKIYNIFNLQLHYQQINIYLSEKYKNILYLTMGINSSQGTPNQSDFNINDWDNILFQAGSRILANRRNPHLQIEQHTIIVSSQRDLELAQELFFLRKHHPSIVNAYHYEIFDLNRSPNHHTFTGLLYTERVHTRLTQMSPVSFPDCLHVIAQSIYGFEKLAQYYSYFKVNGSFIGVNWQKIVKVWHHPNYASIYPYQSAFSEQQMILSILETLQPFIDEFTMPRQQPSFKKFVQKQIKYLNFEIVKAKLIEYARIFNNGYISTKLQYIEPQKKPTTVRYPNPPISQNFKYAHQNSLNQSLVSNQTYTQPTSQNRYQQTRPISYVDPNKINYFPPLKFQAFNDNRSYIIPTPQPRPLQIQTERTMVNSNSINQPYIRNSQIKPIFQNVCQPVSYIQQNLPPNFNPVSTPLVIKQSNLEQPLLKNYSNQNQSQFNLNLQKIRNISGVNSVNRNFVGHNRQKSISDKNSIKSNEFRPQFNHRTDSIQENSFKPMSTLHPIINRSSSVQNNLFAIQKKPKSFRQRSHSEMNRFFKDQVNSSVPFEQKKSIHRLQSQEEDNQVSYNNHRQLKPLSIKQSIQGLQSRRTNSPGSNLHQSNLHRIPISPQTQRISRPQVDNKYLLNQINKLQKNEYPRFFQQNALGNFQNNNMAKEVKLSIIIPQNRQNRDQQHQQFDNYRRDGGWPHPQIFSSPRQQQSQKVSLIKLSKVKMQEVSNTEKYNQHTNFYQRDPPNYQYSNRQGFQARNPAHQVDIQNLYSSLGAAQPVRDNNAKYYNLSQVQSVNNSVQNFYPNNLSSNYSQVVDFNTSMDFRLARKQNNPYQNSQYEDKQIINNKHLTNSKLFQQQKQSKGVTSLDLMSKLKITTTITKDEDHYDKLPLIKQQKQKQKQKSKLPQGTKQFNRDVAKLGFHMYSEESSINDIESPTQKQKICKQETEKQNVKQWTLSLSDYNTPKQLTNEKQKQKSLTYEQLLQSYNFNNYIRSQDNKINFRTEQKQYENPTYNHTYADQQQFRYDLTSSYGNKPLTSSSSSKQYYNTFSKITAEVTNQQKDSDYKFDWDPEILADLQSKAYKQSYQ